MILLKIRYKYIGIPIPSLNKEVREVELEVNSTLNDLLTLLEKDINGEHKSIFKTANFLVNNSRASRNTLLFEGDMVWIFTVLGGG